MTDSSTSEIRSSTAPAGQAGSYFVTTRWSVVLRAGDRDSDSAQVALATLCQTYWSPLYVFLRRTGHNAHDAEDFIQEFFARLIQKKSIQAADPKKGRFRSFLLATLKHFLAHEWEKARAEKRGGKVQFIPLISGTTETQCIIEPASTDTPDKAFDRQWALTLLETVLGRLRLEYTNTGRESLFCGLKETLATGTDLSYAEIGRRLGMSEGAVKVAAHRLRRRYRELLREEIAQTVATPEDAEAELRHLFAALGE